MPLPASISIFSPFYPHPHHCLNDFDHRTQAFSQFHPGLRTPIYYYCTRHSLEHQDLQSLLVLSIQSCSLFLRCLTIYLTRTSLQNVYVPRTFRDLTIVDCVRNTFISDTDWTPRRRLPHIWLGCTQREGEDLSFCPFPESALPTAKLGNSLMFQSLFSHSNLAPEKAQVRLSHLFRPDWQFLSYLPRVAYCQHDARTLFCRMIDGSDRAVGSMYLHSEDSWTPRGTWPTYGGSSRSYEEKQKLRAVCDILDCWWRGQEAWRSLSVCMCYFDVEFQCSFVPPSKCSKRRFENSRWSSQTAHIYTPQLSVFAIWGHIPMMKGYHTRVHRAKVLLTVVSLALPSWHRYYFLPKILPYKAFFGMASSICAQGKPWRRWSSTFKTSSSLPNKHQPLWKWCVLEELSTVIGNVWLFRSGLQSL